MNTFACLEYTTCTYSLKHKTNLLSRNDNSVANFEHFLITSNSQIQGILKVLATLNGKPLSLMSKIWTSSLHPTSESQSLNICKLIPNLPLLLPQSTLLARHQFLMINEIPIYSWAMEISIWLKNHDLLVKSIANSRVR